MRLLQARPAAVGHVVTVTWAGRTATADHDRQGMEASTRERPGARNNGREHGKVTP